MLVGVERVVVLGRSGAGKTTAAAQLGQLTGIPVLTATGLPCFAPSPPTPEEPKST
jgi:ABC-type glutathione transport system ATPase component